ncbi:unnamed protein product, partial [Mesorhabditis belari]|uniref:Small ribosomal subunit protein mS26 n=1 Tax=Mesorhabditis belari TaxID=2138241 RepID=A0AAF3EEM8_9BILA
MLNTPSTSFLRKGWTQIGQSTSILVDTTRGMGRKPPKQGKPPILPPSKKVLYHVVHPKWEKPENVKELLWRRFTYNNAIASIRQLYIQESISRAATGQGLEAMKEEEAKELNLLIIANNERNLQKAKEREVQKMEKWKETRQEVLWEIQSTVDAQAETAARSELEVRTVINRSSDFVSKENLEKKILEALETPKVYDFAIDKAGAKLESPTPVKYQEGTPTVQKTRLYDQTFADRV